MRKKLFLIFVLNLVLVGCSDLNPVVTNTPLVGKLTFAGSTTVQPLVYELGNIFQENNPEILLEIAAGGSKVGIQAVHDGAVDIGMASRKLSAFEAEGIQQYQISVDVIAIVVHPLNPVQDLSTAELRAIYSGEITNWKELGGEDEVILPIIREETSGTRGAFDDLVLNGKIPRGDLIITAVTAGDVAELVSQITPSIGYIGFGHFEEDIKVLPINSVAPSVETAMDGSYLLTRPLLLLTGSFSQPIAQEFISFVLDEKGQAIVEESGWIPLR